MQSLTIHLPDIEATAAFARRLAAMLAPLPGAVVYLRGPLGAGKTSIARELLRSMGVRGTIRSPTYTLMEPYELDDRRVLHMDLYRLQAPELSELGLDDFPPSETLWLVEWPEQGEGHLPPPDLDLKIELLGDGRKVLLSTMLPIDSGALTRLAGKTD